MKKSILLFLALGIGLMNCSFVKANDFDDRDDNNIQEDCLIIKNKTDNNQNLEHYDNRIYISYYQYHIAFIKQFILKHPYLRKDILKYHKLFNLGFLEVRKNGKISNQLLKKINKNLNNLYLKVEQYE